VEQTEETVLNLGVIGHAVHSRAGWRLNLASVLEEIFSPGKIFRRVDIKEAEASWI